ncbi:DNA polymerase I [Intestinibacillus massiliensis]|nr:DNA polymerase I [Intestinibacillus massiliensis]
MKIMVIDGNSILNRAFYGVRLLTNHDGLFTNAIYGFLSTYFKLQEDEKPDRTVVCFDVREKTFRHKQYEGYKAQRKGMPDELAMQMPVLKDVLDAMGVTRCELAGYEADDLIGTISRKAGEQGDECVVVTGDRDSLQLIGGGTTVRLVSTRMGQTTYKNYDTALFEEEYGFAPPRLIDLKSLMGDASDNIPGVPGVGEKTAMALLHSFGTLDGVYAHLDDPAVKKGVRAKLEAGEESARMSYMLATIDRDVPLPLDVSALPEAFADAERLYALLTRLEFKSFIKKMGLEESAAPAAAQAQREVLPLDTAEAVFELLGSLRDGDPAAAVVPVSCASACLLCGGKAAVFASPDFSADEWREILRRLFSGAVPLVMHDAKELLAALMGMGLSPEGVVFDTCLGAYLLNPAEGSYDLERVALSYLNTQLPPASFEDEAAFSPLGGREDAVAAIVRHAEAVEALYQDIAPKIEAQGMKGLYYDVELPLMTVLADMQRIGCKADPEQLRRFGEALDERVAELTTQIYEDAGEEFNINSTKVLGGILFDKLGLPALKKTKTGYSTNADVLEALRGYHPIIGNILEYRQLTKLKSTYVDGLLKVIDPADGRIHSHFQQTVTATGRLSSVDPNLQNIPVRTELGRELRRMFVAEDADTVLVDADYSQIELRVLAHIAQDPVMIQAFREGRDIHATTASQVFHVPLEEVTPQMRSSCKAVNFGIVYGISDFSLAQDIGVSRREAGEYIAKYLDTYSGVKRYMEETKQHAKEKGYVETLFGRRRYLPELQSKNFNIRSFGERVAMNMPIQGTAADIIKIAMVRIWKRLRAENRRARLILQVHDELIIEAPAGEQEAVTALLREEMEGALQMDAPLVAEAKAGHDWYTAH